MGLAAIFFALVFVGLGQFVSASGTLYQKVSDDGNEADVPTKYYHRCSIKNNCKYVGIPVDNAGDKAYYAATMQELQVTGEKQQMWKKIELEDTDDETTNAKGKQIYDFANFPDVNNEKNTF